jgi:hypothetical protein
MPESKKNVLREEEWNFQEMLKNCNAEEVRFCHWYEFGREALDYAWLAAHRRFTLGDLVVLYQHPDVLSEKFQFYTYYFSRFEEHFFEEGLRKGIWLKVPYFDLPPQVRTSIAELEKSRLSGLIDPRCLLDRGKVERIELLIPLNASFAHLCACFAAYLEVNFSKRFASDSSNDVFPKQGGEAPIRQWKADLRSLGALRLMRRLSINQATDETKVISGMPLYSNPSQWSVAKKRANKVIELFEADLLPAIELLATAPQGVTQLSYDSESGKLEYR